MTISSNPRLIVVVPTRNEEETVVDAILELKEGLRASRLDEYSILVVDDSTDETPLLAARQGCNVVRGEGRGLGTAMYKGLKIAARKPADIIITIDADMQFDPKEIRKLVDPILQGKAKLVLGSRFSGNIEYRMPFVNRVGNSILSFMVRRMTGLNVTDAQTGFRAMVPEVPTALDMIGTYTYVQETIIDACEKGYPIVEVPVRSRKRAHGTSKVVASPLRYALMTTPVLILRAGLYHRIFPVLGTILTLGGFAYGFSVLVSESFNLTSIFSRIPALIATSLLVLTGILIGLFGVIVHVLVATKFAVDKLRYSQEDDF